MKKITPTLLRAINCCPSQIAVFEAEWPGGVHVTVENAIRALHLGLNVTGLADRLLDDRPRESCQAAIRSALAAYESAVAPARARYWGAAAPVQAEYDSAKALALAAFQAEAAPAQADLRAAVAATVVDAWRQQAIALDQRKKWKAVSAEEAAASVTDETGD